MAKTKQNDTFYQGNARKLRFTLFQADGVTPLPLISCLVRWAMVGYNADGTYSATPILKKDSGSVGGVSIVTPSADVGDPYCGVVEVLITKENSAALLGMYYHELEVVDVDGEPDVVSTGTLTIRLNLNNA